MPRLSNMSRGLRAYGDRMGAISSNVASNVGNLRMRAADSRARGIEGRGRTFQNLAQGLSGMVGQELQARPQRRMAAEDRRMNQQEQMMRMDQAQQGLDRGDQQLTMNDEKMAAMQQKKRDLLAVQEIRSQFPDDPTAAAAELMKQGFHDAGQKILDTQIAFETAKRDLGDKEIKASEQATKMLATDLDASQVSDEDLSEWYRSTGQRLKGSPLYKEFGSLIDQYFSNPAEDPGLRDFLNQAHRDVADSTYFLKQEH